MEQIRTPENSPKKVKRKSLGNSVIVPNSSKIVVNNNKAAMPSAVNGVSPKKVASPTVTTTVDCLEGMSTAELIMVRRLAGNDPMVRKKTLRKLRKWLNVLSQKVPDSPDSRMMIEANFIRVWKALFYCMWMADKPLPQEQLAESVSDLQNIFASKTAPFLLFVEWFVRTMAREWSWIDRFRMDKFMMLFRRFLRKSLIVISNKKWQNDILEGFTKIISTYIFNRHAPIKVKKNQPRAPATPITLAPLGLQIHFTDVFMEELAKVGGSSLKFQKILKVLTVFINELGHSNDDRLLEEIRERIFNHLMRQSDVALDYQEEMAFGGAEEEDDSKEIGEEEEELGEEDQFLEDEAENDIEANGVLDPRAGAVDVILPQLDVDYGKLYEKLIEFGGQKEIKLKNRRILYSLASQFKELTEGKYPLALPEDSDQKPAIPRKQINKAAKELVEMEMAETSGKRRKTKKERKREAKKRLSTDSVGSEDSSQFIQDEDLLDHACDNYMSYLEDELEDGGEQATTDDGEIADISEEQDDQVDAVVVEEKPKKGGKQGRKRKWKTVVEVEADDQSNVSTDATTTGGKPNKDGRKATKKDKEEVILVKRPKIAKRGSLGSNTVVTSTPLRGKVRRLSELRTPTANISSPLNTSASKRVSFVLARNKEHDHADYPVSIARSPAIPFDKHKQPGFGLLKSPLTTPKSTPARRAAALDFF